MSRDRHNLIIAALAALMTGGLLGVLGFGPLQVGLVGAVVFVLAKLGLKNGLGRQAITMGGRVERESALHAPAGEDRPSLIVFREGGRPNLGIDISLDGKALARVKGACFTQISLSPGTHTIGATFSQGILGAVPIKELTIYVVSGGATAVAASMPSTMTVKAVELRVVTFDSSLRERLISMDLVLTQQSRDKV